MPTFKIEKNKDYTVMSNYHLRDKRLSLKAKGLLSFMLSLPEDWDYSLNGLVAMCKEGRDAIQNTLDELKTYSYVKIEQLRSQKGLFEYEYTIYEKPSNIPLKNQNLPHTSFPYMDEPFTDNPLQLNTNIQNTNKQKDIIDKIDKWVQEVENEFSHEENREPASEEVSHNILTKELIRVKYIEEDDPNLLFYDGLFQEYLKQGNTYSQLLKRVSYITKRVIDRNFIDDDGKKIGNKYKYFEKSLKRNFEKEESRPDEIYGEQEIKELLDMFEGR